MAVDTEDLKPAPTSAKEAKAAAKAAKAHAKAMRPWYKKKRFILPLGIVVIGIGASAASGGSKSSTKDTSSNTPAPAGVKSVNTGDHDASADVELTKCNKGSFGIAEVQVKITNHTSKRSNYLISANLEDASGTKVGEANGASNNVEPGQSAIEDLAAGSSGDFTKCSVKEVTRLAS